MLVGSGGVGSVSGQRYVFDFVSGAWSEAAAPPGPPAGEFVGGVFDKPVWTGTELVFLNKLPNVASSGGIDAAWSLLPGRAYRPATNTWRVTPQVDVVAESPVWTGSEIVDYASEFVGIGASRLPGVARYNPN